MPRCGPDGAMFAGQGGAMEKQTHIRALLARARARRDRENDEARPEIPVVRRVTLDDVVRLMGRDDQAA